MNGPTLGISDVVCMRIVKRSFHTAQGKLRSELTFKAPKRQKFVLLLLGVCDEGTEQDVDADSLLIALGWTPPNDEETTND